MKGDSAQESKYSFKLQRKKGRNELDLEPCPKQVTNGRFSSMHFLTAWGMMRGFFFFSYLFFGPPSGRVSGTIFR